MGEGNAQSPPPFEKDHLLTNVATLPALMRFSGAASPLWRASALNMAQSDRTRKVAVASRLLDSPTAFISCVPGIAVVGTKTVTTNPPVPLVVVVPISTPSKRIDTASVTPHP